MINKVNSVFVVSHGIIKYSDRLGMREATRYEGIPGLESKGEKDV